MNQHLAYGDIIRIYCTLQDNQDRKTSSKISGFLVSKGFADNNIYFLKSKKFTQFELRNSLFEILPYSSFDIHDQKKNTKNNQKSKDMQNIQSRMDTQKDQFQNKCQSFRGNNLNFDAEIIIRHVNSGSYLQGEFSCPETGIGSFKIILSDELSSLIKFKIIRFRNSDKEAEDIQSKDEFRLYHCASHCYLNLGDQNHEIFLDNDISFKELYVPNFKKNDQAHIYMHIRPSIKKPFNIQQNDNSIKRYQVVNQSKATLILNFLPQKKCTKTILIQEQSKIQHNDVVYIKNTKNNSYLVADLWTGEINMKALSGGKKNDLPYEGLWEVCIHRDSEKGVSLIKDYFLKHYITDMIVRIQTNINGEIIKINEQELLNSEKNAKVIRIINYPEGNQILKHRSLILLQKYTFHYQKNSIKRQSKRRLSVYGNPNVEDPLTPKQYLDISKKVSKIYMNKLQEKIDQNEQIFKLDLRKDSIENTFQIFKFDKNKLKLINKILSCVQSLTKFCDILINFNRLVTSQQINSQQCQKKSFFQESSQIHQTQKSIIHEDKTKQKQVSNIQSFFSKYVNYYILNVVIYTTKYLKSNVKIGTKIQFDFIKMMQSLGMVEIIVQNIYFLDRTFKSIKNQEDSKKQSKKPGKDILSKKKYERDRLNQVFKQMYTLLTLLAQENQCRLYIAKWLQLFLNHFYIYKEDYIHEFLLQLLKEQFINKNCITKTDIKKCIDELIYGDRSENLKYKQDIPNYKFLQLLSGFCCTKKTAVPQHQNYIIKQFIAKNKFIYKFDTKNMEDTKQKASHSSQKSNKKHKIRIKLREGNDDSDYILMSDHTKFKRKELWTYIIFLLNLVADLSFQQINIPAILEEVVNLEVIKSFFKTYEDQDLLNKEENNNQKAKLNNIYLPFLKLAHYSFINIHEIEPETYLTRLVRNQIITNWEEPPEINNIYNNPLRDLTGHVRIFFTNFFEKELNIKNQYNLNRLKTTQTTLEFIKTVIKYSSWQQENKKLIPLIIYSVTKLKTGVVTKGAIQNGVVNHQKIKQNVKKLRSNKEILRLLIDTRNIATEILDIRMDIINNIRLVELTKFFKKFYQNNIDTGKGQYFARMENEQISNKIQSPSIWIKQIAKNCENDIMLISKGCLIKCLVECTFVDSLKIVGKILNIIFKLYESKKILIERFSQNFIIENNFFMDIFKKGKQWIANFQKSRQPDAFSEVIISLKLFSDAIRKPKTVSKCQSSIFGKQVKPKINRNIILNELQTKFTDLQRQMQKFLSNLKLHQYLIKFSSAQLFSLNRNIRQNLDYIYQYLTLLIFDNPRNKRILSNNIDFTFKHIKYNTKCIDFLSELFRNNKKLLFDKQIVIKVCNLILEQINQLDIRAHESRAKLMGILRIFCMYNNKAYEQNQKLILNMMQNKKYAEKLIFSTKEFEQDQRNKNLYRNLLKQIQENNYSDSQHSLENMNQYLIQQQFCEDNQNNLQNIQKNNDSSISAQKHAYQNKYDYIQEGINQYITLTQYLYIQPSQFYPTVQKIQDIQLPPVILQLMAYFSTMSALVEGRNQINIGKCSNMHSYQSLLFLLYYCRRCWPLVGHIRAFINKLYYIGVAQQKMKEVSVTEKSCKTILINRQIDLKPQLFIQSLFKMQIPLLKLSLRDLSSIYFDEYDRYQQIKITNSMRYQYFISYIYYTFLQTLYSILKIFSSIQFQQALQIRINQVYKEKDSSFVKKIIENIGLIYKNSRTSNLKQIKILASQLSKVCCTIIKHIDNSRLQRPQNIETNSNQMLSTSVSNQLSRGITLNKSQKQKMDIMEKEYSLDKSIIIIRDLIDGKTNQKYLFMKKHFIEDNQNKYNIHARDLAESDSDNLQPINDITEFDDLQMQINQQLQRVNISLANSHQVKEMIEKQFDELVELCCNLDKIYETVENDEPIYKIIDQRQFLVQIIKLVTKSPPHLTLSNKIKAIKLLRMIFQKKVNNQMNFQNRTAWCSYHFQNQQQQAILQHHQRIFKQMNLAGMIVAILKQQTSSYELLHETFLIGVSLLYNGNSQCQTEILQHLKNDTQNLVIMQLCAFIRKIKADILNNKFVLPKQNNFNICTDEQKIQRIFIDSLQYYDRDLRSMVQTRSQEDTILQSTHEIQIKIQCVCKAYNFLQLLCENDNIQLKNFLRQQLNSDKSVKYNSINLLTQTSKLFQIVLEIFDSQAKNNVILSYIAQFFIEVTQIPCIQNQRQLVSTSIFNDIKSYYYENKLEQPKSISYLLDFVVNVGLSLLEGDDNDIYEALIFSFDSEFLYEIFLYQKKQLDALNKKNPECPKFENINKHTLKILVQEDSVLIPNINIKKRLNSLFKLLSFVKKLSIYQQQKQYRSENIVINSLLQVAKKKQSQLINLSESDRSMTQVISDLSTNYLLHIQVSNQNKKQFIYFPNLPIFDYISEETKNYILFNVKRDKQIDKITQFISKSVEVNQQMNWNYKVENRISISSKSLDVIRRNILFLTIFIQILYVIFSQVLFVQNNHKIQIIKFVQFRLVRIILHTLCILQLFASLYFIYIWTILKYRLSLQRELQSQSLMKQQQIKIMLNKIDEDKDFEFQEYILCLRVLAIHEIQIFNIFFFICSSILGYLFGYEYYSLLIFDILARNQTLQNVIQAITRNLKQLFFVSLLIFLFVYIFNLLSIEFDLYLPYIYLEGEEKCQILSDCIMSLYTSGIVGQKNTDFKMFRFFTDLIYVIIMELLFSNIISGIMIDTFAQLRDSRKIKQADQKNICFICGISKAALQKKIKQNDCLQSVYQTGDIFQTHITKVHYQWNYLFYLYILAQKDKTEYTGIQYMIHNQHKQDLYDWIPMEYEQNESEVEKLLDAISSKINDRDKFKKLK